MNIYRSTQSSTLCPTNRRREPCWPTTHHQHLAAVLHRDVYGLAEQVPADLFEVVCGGGIFAVLLTDPVHHVCLLLLVPEAAKETVNPFVVILLEFAHTEDIT